MDSSKIDLKKLPHREKFESLLDRFKQLKRVLVAYSGGVDSTLLLKAGAIALGEDCVGVTARSETLTDFEYQAALGIARDYNLNIHTIEYSELEIPHYADNPTDRCYYCKYELFRRLHELAAELGIEVIAEGSNIDDLDDWRPGMRAVEEFGIVSPLRDAQLGKDEIRDLVRELGLPNWDKPSSPCLSSRIAYGIQIDPEKLRQVAGGEAFLRGEGFRQVRVRHHGDLARVEVTPDEIDRLVEPDMRRRLAEVLLELGFRYVTVDLVGYRMGSLNEGFTRPRLNTK